MGLISVAALAVFYVFLKPQCIYIPDAELGVKPSTQVHPQREKPNVENPGVDNPVVGKPVVENPAQLNTKEIITDKLITDLSITHSFFQPEAEERMALMMRDIFLYQCG